MDVPARIASCLMAAFLAICLIPGVALAEPELASGETAGIEASQQAGTYTVCFKANGGEGEMGAQVVKTGRQVTLNPVKFKREGYKFAGWNAKASGKGEAYKNKAKVKDLAPVGEKVALYAQWKATKEILKKNKVKAAYRRVLAKARAGTAKYGGWKLDSSSSYSLFDIDRDGVPELIVDTIPYFLGRENLVFDYHAGKARYLGYLLMDCPLYTTKSGRLYEAWSISGVENGVRSNYYNVCRVVKKSSGVIDEVEGKTFSKVKKWEAYLKKLRLKPLAESSVKSNALLNY